MNLSHLLSRYYLFFACGDAVGKATEFMTLNEISAKIGHIDGLVSSVKSQNHSDLKEWEVTDDTEQNMYLLRAFLKDRDVTIENTVNALLDWIDSTGAVEKKYIGPSSLAALNSIKAGTDPYTTGLNGTTCGGIMRCPAAAFASLLLEKDMDKCIFNALVPTHYTSTAMESAYAYAYALRKALEGAGLEEVLDSALEGCEVGLSKAQWVWAGATLKDRIKYMRKLHLETWSDEEVKSFIYGVLGSGLPSYETSAAVFALLMHTQDPVKVLFLASETGGDTDTIAALAASLASMINRETQMPESIAKVIKEHNNLEIL